MKISIQYNKTGFIPSCGCIHATVWMHPEDANKTHREKSRWEILKNAMSYFKQNVESTLHETIAVRPLFFSLKKYLSKMNKICRTLPEKQGRTHKWHSLMDSYTWRASVGRLARTYLYLLCEDKVLFEWTVGGNG